MRQLFILTAALASGLASTPAIAEVSLQTCAQNRLAARRGSIGCWAQLSLKMPGGSLEKACIGKVLWQRMMHGQGARCGTWQGQWKIYSPPLNELSVTMGSKPRKEILRSFRVREFPNGVGGLAERTVWRIERAREQADAWITPMDGTGVLRMLLSGTQPPGGSLALLSLLGFVHLLLAAGIHLYALAACIHWALKRVAIGCESLPLGWAKKLAAGITAAIWLFAWLLEGGRPGMLRPWIVVCLRMGARRLGLRWRRLAPLGIALAVDLAVAIARGELGGAAGHGRWVYALACGGGLLARSAPWAAVGSWILAAWLEVGYGGTVALATPLLSAITVPLYAGVIYPLLLLGWSFKIAGLSALGDCLGATCGHLSEWCVRALALVAMHVGALWSVSGWALIAGWVLGALFLGTQLRTRTAALALLLTLRLGFVEARAWQPPSLERQTARADKIWQLDIGQGDAALVRSRSADGTPRFGLIDGGPERALSDRAWLELFSQAEVRQLDWIAITHLDEDHAGGLKRLALLVRIKCVATAREQLDSDRGRKFVAELRRVGVRLTSWEGGCVPFPVLGPPSYARGSGGRKPRQKGNAAMSAVFVPLTRGGFYLSAGDADARDEPRIGRWAAAQAKEFGRDEFNRPPASRILKVSHHGSRTSSNPEFLKSLRPTEAWISSGVGNRYGHPMASVLQRLNAFGISVRRTDEEGVITIDASSIKKLSDTL
jgi:competence protein ComEC